MANVKFAALAWRILELPCFEKNLSPRRPVQEEIAIQEEEKLIRNGSFNFK
jgi:hypothetical protein